MKLAWLSLEGLTKIITAASALIVAVSILYGVIVLKGSITWEGALGKLTLGTVPAEPVGGAAGVARPGSSKTVWVSKCPENTKAISGKCIAQEPGGGVPLQNIGPDGQNWECAWAGPMAKADVQAVCVPESKLRHEPQ
jgi:hypothetical protein